MQKIFLGCTLHWQQLQFLHAIQRGVSPLRAQLAPAPAPGTSTQSAPHTHNKHQQPGSTLLAPSTGAHKHPAPCFHHAHSQLTAPSTSTQRPHPVCTTRTASSQSTTHTQHPATAPSTGTLSPPRAQQGITTYDLARASLRAQKYAHKRQSP